jgi:hypothetical protein
MHHFLGDLVNPRHKVSGYKSSKLPILTNQNRSMDLNLIIENWKKLVVWLLRVVHWVSENTKRGTIPLNQFSPPPEELSALLETNFPSCALVRMFI